MKSFLAALIVFCLVIGCAAAHAVFLRQRIQEMLTLVRSLPADAAPADGSLGEARLRWESLREVVSYTVPEERTRSIDLALNALEAASDDAALYRQSRADLIRALDDLREAEGCSLRGIF